MCRRGDGGRGVAWADGLPRAAQVAVAHAAERVGIDLPGNGDDHHEPADKHEADDPGKSHAAHPSASGDAQPVGIETPPVADPVGGGEGGHQGDGEHQDPPTTEPGDGTGEHHDEGDGVATPPATEPGEGEHHETPPTTEPHRGEDDHETTTTTVPHGGDGEHHETPPAGDGHE